MTEPMAADDACEHHYETRILGGRPISVPACVFCRTPDWADLDEQAAELYRWGWQEGCDGKAARETLSAYDKPRQALGGPQAPQDGPEATGAGASTPGRAGGSQTGAEPLARFHRLRGQLAAEHAKAVRADQHPRPDLDHLRVTAHNGIAAGLENAIFFADHHLREAGEEARTTPDNTATSSNTADNPLRQQYAAALSTLTVLGGAPPARLVPVVRWGAGEVTRIVDWRPLDTLLDALLAVRDRELERLQAQLDEAQQNALALDQGREELFARIAQVRALRQPDPDGRTGYQPDADDTPGAYGDIAQACRECGSSDLAVRWPCPTILALDPPAPQEPGEQP